jgi:hypothetical protein
MSNLNLSAFGSSASSLEEKLSVRSLQEDVLFIRVNVAPVEPGRMTKANRPSQAIFTTQSGAMLNTSSKGVFMKIKGWGVHVLNPITKSWDAPPARTQGDRPVRGAKPTGLYAQSIHFIKGALEMSGQPGLAAQVNLDYVWDDEIKFNVPMNFDELDALRNQLMSDDGRQRLACSLVFAVKMNVSDDGSSFGLICSEVLNPLAVLPLPTGGIRLGANAYVEACERFADDSVDPFVSMQKSIGDEYAAKMSSGKPMTRAAARRLAKSAVVVGVGKTTVDIASLPMLDDDVIDDVIN